MHFSTSNARFLAGLAALGAVASATSSAAAPPAFFDKPAQVVRVPLRNPDDPQAKAKVSCFYFAHFMVKEVDLGEKGADQLSVLPLSGTAKPPCRRENAPDEKVVPDWSGYFKGVKGDYVLFDADDGWNDGIGFAVIDGPSGKKLFEDVAKKLHDVALTPAGLTLKYSRVFGASCSLKADAAVCWEKIKQDTGLAGTAPDCNALYEREKKRTPEFAQLVNEDPTIVDYEAETTIAAEAKISPVSGKALACRPAE
jgi:hypothetical protein